MYRRYGFALGRWRPASPTTEFAHIKSDESAAVCLGDAQYSAMSIGARNTNPPPPVTLKTGRSPYNDWTP
jgi:hypothetical protein